MREGSVGGRVGKLITTVVIALGLILAVQLFRLSRHCGFLDVGADNPIPITEDPGLQGAEACWSRNFTFRNTWHVLTGNFIE